MDKKLTFADLEKRYQGFTDYVRAECVVATELVGGMPAKREDLLAFAQHHLKIEDPEERNRAVDRILKEEIGESNVTPQGGEIKEKKVYGVNIIRRDAFGPWLGPWMIKACIKAAASRLDIFMKNRGVKGDFAHSGRVSPIGVSLRPSDPYHVYLKDEGGKKPAVSYFQEFMGRVTTQQGAVSIIHHSECVAPGSRFDFEFRFINRGLESDDIEDIFALGMTLGLGSCKALERGKFRIESLELHLKDKPAEKAKKPKADRPHVVEAAEAAEKEASTEPVMVPVGA